ncbi:MAG: hypothetical protein ACP5RC_09530, partial [Halothiobacillaceae bacterium]
VPPLAEESARIVSSDAGFLPIEASSPIRTRQEANKNDPVLREQVARIKEVRDMMQMSARQFAQTIEISYALLVAYTKFRVSRVPDKVLRAVEEAAKTHRAKFKSEAEWVAYNWLKDAPMAAILARWAEALNLSLSDIKASLEVRCRFADALKVPRPSVIRWLAGQKPTMSRITAVDRQAAQIKARRMASSMRKERADQRT